MRSRMRLCAGRVHRVMAHDKHVLEGPGVHGFVASVPGPPDLERPRPVLGQPYPSDGNLAYGVMDGHVPVLSPQCQPL